MDITRRDFIFGAIATVAVAPLDGFASHTIGKSPIDDAFEDIGVDRYYILQGGQYGDTGGWGQPGYKEGPEIITQMKYWEHRRELEDKLDYIEKHGFYLTPTQYFGASSRKFNRIYLTKDWMMEFYRRHKDEPLESWESRYDRYLNDVNSGKYSPENIY